MAFNLGEQLNIKNTFNQKKKRLVGYDRLNMFLEQFPIVSLRKLEVSLTRWQSISRAAVATYLDLLDRLKLQSENQLTINQENTFLFSH